MMPILYISDFVFVVSHATMPQAFCSLKGNTTRTYPIGPLSSNVVFSHNGDTTMKSKKIALILGVVLVCVSGVLYAALPPRISWTPTTLSTESIAPGSSRSYTVTLSHTGILPVLATNQLRIVAEGVSASYLTIVQPTFPSIFKRGNSVQVKITVSSPANQAVSIVPGVLVLKRILPGGATPEVWRADELPVSLTFAPFYLPKQPDPKVDVATIGGVDSDANGVPDRVDRWIGVTEPTSAKKRMALTLSARAEQTFVTAYFAHKNDAPVDIERIVKANDAVRGKALNCISYVYSDFYPTLGWEEMSKVTSLRIMDSIAQYTDTPARLRNYQDAERPLVATGYPDIPFERYKQECLDLRFDPDNYPN
jgi:hypothetical protein